jgi:WD40 repeat protein
VGLALGGQIVTADGNGDLRVWPTQDPLLRSNASPGRLLSADRAGHWLALATAFDGIALWDTSSDGFRPMPAPAVTLAPKPDGTPESLAAGIAVDPQGRFLIAGTDGGNVITWPLTSAGAGPASVVSAVPGQDIGHVAVNPAGDVVAAVPVNDGSEVALLRFDATGQLARVGSIPTRNPRGASFSADGTLLAVPRGSAQVEIWSVGDPAHPTLATTIQLASQPVTVAFAPGAAMLAVGEVSGEVPVFDLANPAAPRDAGRHHDARSEVSGLTWSSDGTLLLGSAADGHVWQWDATRQNSPAVASYGGGLGRANDVTFVHDGRQFVATGDTGEVRVWIAGRDDARRHLCVSQGSPLSDAERADWLPGVPALDPCRGVG